MWNRVLLAPVTRAEIALYKVVQTNIPKSYFGKMGGGGGQFWFSRVLKWCALIVKLAPLEPFHAFRKEENWPIFCGQLSPIYVQKKCALND